MVQIKLGRPETKCCLKNTKPHKVVKQLLSIGKGYQDPSSQWKYYALWIIRKTTIGTQVKAYLVFLRRFLEGFPVFSFKSDGIFACSTIASSGVHSMNFLLEPTWLQSSFSIFLPLIHLNNSFKCVLLLNPPIPVSCEKNYREGGKIRNLEFMMSREGKGRCSKISSTCT